MIFRDCHQNNVWDLFKVNYKDLKTLEWRHWRRYGVFLVNFEQIPHIALVFPLLTLNNWLPAAARLVLYSK